MSQHCCADALPQTVCMIQQLPQSCLSPKTFDGVASAKEAKDKTAQSGTEKRILFDSDRSGSV